jgi:hypothetical protein
MLFVDQLFLEDRGHAAAGAEGQAYFQEEGGEGAETNGHMLKATYPFGGGILRFEPGITTCPFTGQETKFVARDYWLGSDGRNALGLANAIAYTSRVDKRVRVAARVHTSDLAMAMSIMVALQLFGLLAVLQFIQGLT